MTGALTPTRCPYPGCGRSWPGSESRESCPCDYHDPLVVCGSCGTTCPAQARFCRGCRAPLPSAREPGRGAASAAEFLFTPGVFHSAPVAHQRFLWALSAAGEVSRLSLAAGARPRLWASIGSKAVGCNRFAIADAMWGNAAESRPLLVTLDPGAVWTLALGQHQAAPRFPAPAGHEIVANASAAESIGFRGVAVSSAACAFLLRETGRTEAALAIRYFDAERAGEQPFRISGTSFAGPVMENGVAAVCSEEEVGVYHMAEQTHDVYAFRDFTPLPARSAAGPNVLLGVTPLWAGMGERGPEARILGTREGRAGWLRVFLKARPYDEFVPLPPASCISRAEAGLCVNLGDGIDFVGAERRPGRYANLAPRMPVGYARPRLAYFERRPGEGHQLTFFNEESGGLRFTDPDCGPDSCCGIGFTGGTLVVSYFVPASRTPGPGIRSVFWRLSK